MRTRIVLVTTLAAILAACGADTPSAAPSVSAAPSASAAVAAPAVCALTATANKPRTSGTSLVFTVVVTNAGTVVCRLDGYPRALLSGATVTIDGSASGYSDISEIHGGSSLANAKPSTIAIPVGGTARFAIVLSAKCGFSPDYPVAAVNFEAPGLQTFVSAQVPGDATACPPTFNVGAITR